MKTYLVITALLLGSFLLTSCGDSDTPGGGGVATADPPSVKERWDAMKWDEQAAVCQAAPAPLPGEGEVGGTSGSSPDYRVMLQAIIEAGYTQPDAAAMIPYALNECR